MNLGLRKKPHVRQVLGEREYLMQAVAFLQPLLASPARKILQKARESQQPKRLDKVFQARFQIPRRAVEHGELASDFGRVWLVDLVSHPRLLSI